MAVLHHLTANLHTASENIVAALFLGATASLAWVLYRRYRASQELRIPFLKFEDGDDSRQRYATDSGTLFRIGYDKVLSFLFPCTLRIADDGASNHSHST